MAARTAKVLRGAALALVLALAGCAATPELQHAMLPMPKPAQAEMPSAVQRENTRILGAYGGVYENARLQQMVDRLVARLVAASERPDLKYNVTILNSPAINAFALPNGQLYVTRGLVALANDEAELASVLAHEMGHVIARHAQIREEQVRDAELASRTISNVVNDPQMSALALAKSKLTHRRLLARAGIRGRRHRRRHHGARRVRSLRRLAHPRRHAAQCRPQCGRQQRPHRRLPVQPPVDAGAHPQRHHRCAPARRPRHRRARPRPISRRSQRQVYGEDPSEGFVRGRRFIHAKLGFTFLAPPGFTLDNTAQAVLGLKDGGVEALRLDVVSVPAEQPLTDYLKSGWMENVDRRAWRNSPSTASRRPAPAPAARTGRSACSSCASAATSTASSTRPST